VQRHERDAVSLMAGVLLVLGAGLFLLGDLTALELDGRWVAPLVLIVVGGVGLLSTLRSQRADADELP
jgi:hypothetical protein